MNHRKSTFGAALLVSVLLGACGGGGGSTVDPGTGGTLSPPAPTPAPTVTLSATPSVVDLNGSVTLRWSSTNADSCIASGAWQNAKATSGTEQVGPLTQASSFTLTCSGAGGSGMDSVTVAVNNAPPGSTLSGSVDSSHVNRDGANMVYVFSGTVTPDDIDGDAGDPVATAAVIQDVGACTWRYSVGGLADGTYTVAFTNEAGNDNPQQNDAISFVGTTTVSVVNGAATQDFEANRIVRVGPGRQYATPSAAVSAVRDGDVVEIDAGVYQDDIAVWRQNNITLRGVGGKAHLQAVQQIGYTPGDDQRNGMGIWVTKGNNITVENMEFSGATVPDNNGAGIRIEGSNLTVCNSYFHDNENGMLGGGGNMLIEYTEFARNGRGDGLTHNLYIDTRGTRLIYRYNYSHHARIGHNLKTRAQENYILYNRIMDEATGNASYAVDMPNGGLNYLIGNLIQQGPNTDNSSVINYGSEQLLNPVNELYMVNNTVVNDAGFGRYLYIEPGTTVARLVNNLFVGGSGSLAGYISGSFTGSNNINTLSPGLVDAAAFDYRLTATSIARDAGTDPGAARGYDMNPLYQYLHPTLRENRPSNGQIDVGAYEYP